jgi:hypothetical protein
VVSRCDLPARGQGEPKYSIGNGLAAHHRYVCGGCNGVGLTATPPRVKAAVRSLAASFFPRSLAVKCRSSGRASLTTDGSARRGSDLRKTAPGGAIAGKRAWWNGLTSVPLERRLPIEIRGVAYVMVTGLILRVLPPRPLARPDHHGIPVPPPRVSHRHRYLGRWHSATGLFSRSCNAYAPR